MRSERKEFKSKAKETLRECYWLAFVVVLIASIFSLSASLPANLLLDFDPNLYFGSTEPADSAPVLESVSAFFTELWKGFIASGNLSISLTILGLSCLLYLLVGNPMQVGKCRFFHNMQTQQGSLKDVVYSFKEERYGNTVKVLFLKDLIVLGWSVLLVIPGIIASYTYFMVPYLLAEKPKLTAKEALKISKQRMKGHKFELFVLELSFIPWYLLGLLLCCAGIYFVLPYVQCTLYEFYRARMAE